MRDLVLSVIDNVPVTVLADTLGNNNILQHLEVDKHKIVICRSIF